MVPQKDFFPGYPLDGGDGLSSHASFRNPASICFKEVFQPVKQLPPPTPGPGTCLKAEVLALSVKILSRFLSDAFSHRLFQAENPDASPRVLGLTASIVTSKVSLETFKLRVDQLAATLHSRVITADNENLDEIFR